MIDSSQNDPPAIIRKRVNTEIGKLTKNDEFWVALREFTDKTHDGLITRLSQDPKITEKDSRFIQLCCCGLNYVEIALIMNYTPQYISQKRREVARKLHVRVPLQQYLDSFKQTP